MLTIWRRHNQLKCKYKSRAERKCRCPIWISGIDAAGVRVYETTKLRDWTRAESFVRHYDNTGAKPMETSRITIEDWQTAFLADATSPSGKNLNSETIRKYKLLFKQINAFAKDRGFRFVNQLDLHVLTAFRSTWEDAPLSASKKLERLRSILKFALRRKWILDNPASELDSPKLKLTPTLPYSQEEVDRIFKAAIDPRVHAFILTMIHSGLRISDTTTLAVSNLNGNRLCLYQQKTGEYVYVPIPDDVAEALRTVKHKHPDYFFWSGSSKVPAAVSVWRRRLADVFDRAGIKGGHSHRLRDTFAVRMLEAGLSIENVSTLPGHADIKVTQRHYSPWIKTRQDALDREVLKVLGSAATTK
ncbi:MAG: tyrosine-type recombinase/integrase [Candidatus Acidiferrales bacterium]